MEQTFEVRDFASEVLDRSYAIPVLVDFWAEWCGPCRALGPILESLAAEHPGEWVLAKLNTEMHPEIAAQYGVRSIPNVKCFVDGEVIDEFVGVLPKQAILQWLQECLPSRHRNELQSAETLLAKGHVGEAQHLLNKIVAEEPGNDRAKVLLARVYLFSDARKAVEQVRDIRADSEEDEAAESIRTLGRLLGLADAPEQLPEGAAKVRYLNAIMDLKSGNLEGALLTFIEVLRCARDYDEDGARKACVAIFQYLGRDHVITKRHRSSFSRALYV